MFYLATADKIKFLDDRGALSYRGSGQLPLTFSTPDQAYRHAKNNPDLKVWHYEGQ